MRMVNFMVNGKVFQGKITEGFVNPKVIYTPEGKTVAETRFISELDVLSEVKQTYTSLDPGDVVCIEGRDDLYLIVEVNVKMRYFQTSESISEAMYYLKNLGNSCNEVKTDRYLKKVPSVVSIYTVSDMYVAVCSDEDTSGNITALKEVYKRKKIALALTYRTMVGDSPITLPENYRFLLKNKITKLQDIPNELLPF